MTRKSFTKDKIAFSGGCYWCMEAVFEALTGVKKVAQGFIASTGKDAGFSEAVIVHFDPQKIGLEELIEIHLSTHRSSSAHPLRAKYRSTIYTFTKEQQREAISLLGQLQKVCNEKLVTEVLPFGEFKSSDERFWNYYFSDPNRPFCKNHINPKLKLLLQKFEKHVDHHKLEITNTLKF